MPSNAGLTKEGVFHEGGLSKDVLLYTDWYNTWTEVLLYTDWYNTWTEVLLYTDWYNTCVMAFLPVMFPPCVFV